MIHSLALLFIYAVSLFTLKSSQTFYTMVLNCVHPPEMLIENVKVPDKFFLEICTLKINRFLFIMYMKNLPQ